MKVGDRVPGWKLGLPDGMGRQVYWTVTEVDGDTVRLVWRSRTVTWWPEGGPR